MTKRLYSNWLSSLLLFVITIGMISSCKKDNNTQSAQIQLLSFGPTGAKHGDTIRFIGSNLNQVTEIDFTSATVSQSAFVQQTGEVIMVVVPDAAEQGFVTLKTPQGDIVSKTKLNLNVPITVTSMTAQARPGENITISGKFLNWVTSVSFPKDKSVDSFVSRSLTQLVVTVPPDAETGPLVVYYGGTEPGDVETTDTLKVTLPSITALSPNPVKHADNLTISGANLDLAQQVIFTGVATPVTSFVSQSASQIVVKVPAGTKQGKITLVAQSGVSVMSADDLQVLLPAIADLSPNPIDALADLTITGTNLDLVSSVSFTGALTPITTFVSQTATKLVVTVPSGTLKGKVTLGVLNSTLTVSSAADLVLNGGLPPLADFPLPIYTDGLQSGFQNWSWAGNDFSSTANVRQGTLAVKGTYGIGGYEGITFHNDAGVSTAGYTKLEFSVFGEAGTGGKNLNVVVNGNYSSPPQVTIAEGEWKTFSLNLSDLGSPDPLKEIVLQAAGWSGVIYIDHVGLR